MGQIDPVFAGAFIALYVAIQVGLGIWVSRRVRDEADYYVAGRRLGLIPVALSVFATWFGAETVMGSSAAIAQEGLAGARAEPFGYALALVGMALLIAAAFRAKGYMTLADFFADRFGPRSELFATLIMIPISIIWAAAQLVALSAILEAAVGVPASVTLPAATLVVIVYTAFGGLMGDIVTDVIQGVVLLIGLTIVFVGVASAMGGLSAMIARIEPAQLSLLGEGESWINRVDAWVIPIVGSLVAQEAISRFLAANSPKTARRASFAAAGLYLAVGLIPILIGLAGVHQFGANGDDFLPNLARETLTPILFLIFSGALLSAILSTVDSNILAVSSLVSINILGKARPGASARVRLLTARVATLGAGLAAFLVAASGQSIYQLIELTSAFGQAGVFVAVIVGLRSRFGDGAAALAAMGACVLVNLWTMIVWPIHAMMVAEPSLSLAAAWGTLTAGEAPEFAGYFLISLAAAILAYCVTALARRRKTTPAAA